MIRIVVIDAQPAVRTGLNVMLSAEPGLVPCGSADGVKSGLAETARAKPDLVIVDHQGLGENGLAALRRLRALDPAPRIVLYTADPDPGLHVLARVAGADGLLDKADEPARLFDAIRRVARGETALPALSRKELDRAAHRVAPEDLALLAMLVDRTTVADVAETLRLDGRRLQRRIERLLQRLRARPQQPAAV